MRAYSLLLASFATTSFFALAGPGCTVVPGNTTSDAGADANVSTEVDASAAADAAAGPVVVDCMAPLPETFVHTPGRAVDYLVKCEVRLTRATKITAGTVIAFEAKTGFVVDKAGSLDATGTADAPILLRAASAGAKWTGLEIFSKSAANTLNHVKIVDAGARNVDLAGAVLVGAASFAEGNVSIRDCVIEGSATVGLSVGEGGELEALERLVVQGSGDAGVEVNPNVIARLGGAGNKFAGNAKNVARVLAVNTSTLRDASQTWSLLDVPYHVPKSTQFRGIQTVAAGVTVVVGKDAALGFDGALKAIGTESQRISIKPDTGGFARVDLVTKGNVLERCDISGGGSIPNAFGHRGNIVLSADSGGSDVSIRDCVIEGSAGFGVVANGQPVTESGTNTFRNNASGNISP